MTKYTACFSRMEIAFTQPPKNTVLISISDPDSEKVQHDYYDAVLILKFWDVERVLHYGGVDLSPASDEQIRVIYMFIQSHYDKNIFAHCEAGVSRSAAVREYLLRRGWKHWGRGAERAVYPNGHILSGLERIDREQTAPNPTEQKA